MKAVNLLFTLIMVYALKWCSKFHFVNAAIPENIYFPMDNNNYSLNSNGDIFVLSRQGDTFLLIFSFSFEEYKLQSCRYNNANTAVYCQFYITDKQKNRVHHYRLKINLKEKISCDLNEQSLKNMYGVYYFEKIKAQKPKELITITFNQILDDDIVDKYGLTDLCNKKITFTTRNCENTVEIKDFSIYEIEQI